MKPLLSASLRFRWLLFASLGLTGCATGVSGPSSSAPGSAPSVMKLTYWATYYNRKDEKWQGVYNVFLSKITDTSKRDKAAELIAKVKGCSGSEAKELTTRLVIPLAKNVPKAKAEDILNQFKKLKIFGRMTKVK